MCLLHSARSKNHVFLLRPHFFFYFSFFPFFILFSTACGPPKALCMGGYPLGYPDIRQDFRGKGASAPESAPSGGYPLALADIRQGIAGIRDGYPLTISIVDAVFLFFSLCSSLVYCRG
jgi:hypothetical protein